MNPIYQIDLDRIAQTKTDAEAKMIQYLAVFLSVTFEMAYLCFRVSDFNEVPPVIVGFANKIQEVHMSLVPLHGRPTKLIPC